MVQHYYTLTSVEREFHTTARADEVVEALVAQGYTVYAVEQKANQLVPYHKHPSEEVAVVTSGVVRFIVEEEIVDVREGEIIRIAPNSVHANISVCEDGASKLLLSFV